MTLKRDVDYRGNEAMLAGWRLSIGPTRMKACNMFDWQVTYRRMASSCR